MFYTVLRSSNYIFIENFPYLIIDKKKILPSLELMYDEESIKNSFSESFYVIRIHEEFCFLDEKKSENIIRVNLSKDDALKVFNYVFDEPYNHIDIDLVTNKYYKNFNLLTFEDS